MIVDSSTALSWAFSDERTPVTQTLFVQAARDEVHVPAIWQFEVANKLNLGLQKGRLTATELGEVLGTFQLLDVTVHEPASLATLVSAARRFGLTAYDAAFVELAIRLAQPLATFDQKMRTAALAFGVTVVP